MNIGSQERDAGLQFERTGLAWMRSGLLALLVCVLVGRRAVSMASWLHLASASLLGLLACLFLYVGYRRLHDCAEYHEADASALRTAPLCVAGLLAVFLMIEFTAHAAEMAAHLGYRKNFGPVRGAGVFPMRKMVMEQKFAVPGNSDAIGIHPKQQARTSTS